MAIEGYHYWERLSGYTYNFEDGYNGEYNGWVYRLNFGGGWEVTPMCSRLATTWQGAHLCLKYWATTLPFLCPSFCNLPHTNLKMLSHFGEFLIKFKEW